jgi:hypothetical protein
MQCKKKKKKKETAKHPAAGPGVKRFFIFRSCERAPWMMREGLFLSGWQGLRASMHPGLTPLPNARVRGGARERRPRGCPCCAGSRAYMDGVGSQREAGRGRGFWVLARRPGGQRSPVSEVWRVALHHHHHHHHIMVKKREEEEEEEGGQHESTRIF